MFARLFWPTQADVKADLTVEMLVNDDGRMGGELLRNVGVNCLEYLFKLRESLQRRIDATLAEIQSNKKPIIALGFNNKDNKLDDPELVHELAHFDYHLREYVKNVSDKKFVESLQAKLKIREESYLKYGKLKLYKDMVEMAIAAKPVPNKEDLVKLEAETATEVKTAEKRFINIF